MVRKSLQDISHMLRDKEYPGVLPDELKPLHAYIVDSGHVIMCILKKYENMLQTSDAIMYECPVPAKYVLSHPYEIINGHVLIEAEYSETLGLVVDEKYYEF